MALCTKLSFRALPNTQAPSKNNKHLPPSSAFFLKGSNKGLISHVSPKHTLRRNFGDCSVNKSRSLNASASVATGTSLSELDIVTKFSEIIPDTIISDDFDVFPQNAATVTSTVLLGVSDLNNSKFGSAIDSALVYGKCMVEQAGSNRFSCFIDKALVNVGAEMTKLVPGRVSTEVDPRLANDTDAIVNKVRNLLKLYQELEISRDRLLFQIPATWEGIEAARQLEDDDIQTHLTYVYSFAQAAASAQSSASAIQVSVGRIRDWARNNSGDSDVEEAVSKGLDPGIELVTRAFNFIYKLGHKSNVISSALRTKEDVLSLLGVDYLVVPVKVIESLKSTTAKEEIIYKTERRIHIDEEEPTIYSVDELTKWTKERYDAEIGTCGKSLLADRLKSAIAQTVRLENRFEKIWPLPNV